MSVFSQFVDDGPHTLAVRLVTKGVPVIMSGSVSNVKASMDTFLNLCQPRLIHSVLVDVWRPSRDIGTHLRWEKSVVALLSPVPPSFKVCTHCP